MLELLKRLLRNTATAPAPEPVPATAVEQPVIQPAKQTEAYLSGWFQHETGELFTGFPIAAEDSVLDIGCGDGPFAQFCAEQGAEVIFADIDPHKVASVENLLKQSRARSVMPLVTDANPLPLPDERVNRVIAMEVLEHVDDPAQFIKELVRVGKPGALYLFTVPDALGEQVQKHLAPDSYFQHPNHIRIFERAQFEQLVRDAGLQIEHKSTYGFYWVIWWSMFWACKQDLSPPWHPLLESWHNTWSLLLSLPDGPRIKKALDETMPKSQLIIARKA